MEIHGVELELHGDVHGCRGRSGLDYTGLYNEQKVKVKRQTQCEMNGNIGESDLEEEERDVEETVGEDSNPDVVGETDDSGR